MSFGILPCLCGAMPAGVAQPVFHTFSVTLLSPLLKRLLLSGYSHIRDLVLTHILWTQFYHIKEQNCVHLLYIYFQHFGDL
jgi:hypothetical protein